MSTPEGTGAGRPLRTGGMVLLALAAVAALIGLLVVVTDEQQTSASQRPTVTTTGPTPGGGPTSLLPTPTPISPPASTPAAPPTFLPAPPSSPPDPAPPASPVSPGVGAEGIGGSPDFRGEARVYNNSTIRGLAARAADDLSAAGWTVVEVANYSGGRIPTSTVYYQEGTDQIAIAQAIGAEFGMRVEPRFVGIADARPGVIVIVTNDYGL